MIVWQVKRRMRARAIAFVRRHKVRLESARFIDRVWMRERLAWDPTIEEAVVRTARRTGEPIRAIRDKVDAYVDEIAPYFSIAAYYRFGAAIARRFVAFCYELVVDTRAFERQASQVPPNAVRVYVINHRSNVDPLILAFAVMRQIAMSYAVGEWALVWPLSALFRMFGSYFVRRGEHDPLYHTVLERFVQLLAGHGAITGFFPEGALSRDGALRRPRTGLLEYLVGLRHEFPDRDIVFLPVGLNYDRVLEDRTLIAERDGRPPRPTPATRLYNLVAIVVWTPVLIVANLLKVATRSHRKFGYAAIAWGEPLLLSAWPGGPDLHRLPEAARKEAMRELGEELLWRRIARAIPCPPVPIVCLALLRDGPNDGVSLVARIRDVNRELRAVGAPMALGEAFRSIEDRRRELDAHSNIPGLDQDVLDHEEAELMLILVRRALVTRRIVREIADGLQVVPGQEAVVEYYAWSILHHLDPAFPHRREAEREAKKQAAAG